MAKNACPEIYVVLNLNLSLDLLFHSVRPAPICIISHR